MPENSGPKRIGQMAVERGLMTAQDLQDALAEHHKRLAAGSRVPFGELLIDLECISRRQLRRLLTAQGTAPRSPRQIIPGYELIKKLGEGGMGTTYLARQVSLKRLVAIKVLRREYSGDEQFVHRFRREARLAAELDHPNIAQAIDVGQTRGWHYMVMEYVEGRIASDLIPPGGVMEPKLALRITLQVARALEAGYRRGIIHRDIKPDNILITEEGVAKLCDFGLAKKLGGSSHLTQSGVAVGTPHYCSPEQAQGHKDVDIRSDIYSLGATLYHLVTGHLPYYAENAAAIAIKHINEPVPQARNRNPDLPESVERLIATMMAKLPAQRYPTPAELIADIKEVAAGRQIGIQVMPMDTGESGVESPATRPTPTGAARKRRGSNGRILTPITGGLIRRGTSRFDWAGLLIGLGVAAMVGAVVYLTFFHRSPEARVREQLRAVEVWRADNPDDLDGALWRLEKVLSRARNTGVEAEVERIIRRVRADRDEKLRGKPDDDE